MDKNLQKYGALLFSLLFPKTVDFPLYIAQQRLILNQMFCGADDLRKEEEVRGDHKKIEHYLFKSTDKIGEGNFSKVYKGIDRKTGLHVAIKVIKYSSLTSKVAEDLLKNEVKILRELKHGNIIQCLDIFASQNNCYIVTEFCEGGDLQKLLLRKKFMDEPAISRIAYEVFQGLSYLNEMNIIHRDFKIANIFLTKEGSIKIADFGFAVKAKEPFKDISIGSPVYMSPQGMLLHQYGPKTEVWGYGVMLYELIHGEAPLAKCKVEKQLRDEILITPKFKQGISPELRELLQRCLTLDPKNRISMKQIRNTAYMSRLIKEFEGYSIPKELFSTYHSSNSSQSSTLNMVKNIRAYDEGLAILQYCRLVHKTCQKTPSPLLSQWLLSVSWNLQKSKPQHGNPQKIQRFIKTAKDYYVKYQSQHNDNNLIVHGQDIIQQCGKLIRVSQQTGFSPSIIKTKISFLSMLKSQTDMLLRSLCSNNLGQFVKMTQIEGFLNSMKEGSHRKEMEGFNFYNQNL